MRIKKRRLTLSNCVFSFLLIFSIVPDIGIKFSVFGFTWTAYRLTIALSIIAVVFIGRKISLFKSNPLSKWILFMIIWLILGGVLLLVSKYSDRHAGMIELLSIFNGIIVIYMMSVFLASEENLDYALKIMYWLLNFLLLFGLIEIVTGWHWRTSAFRDVNSSIYVYSNHHLATGLMYNMNDYSALITCMSPILLDSRIGKKRFITLGAIFAINIINDATTCTFAIIVFALYYYLILKKGNISKRVILKVVFIALCIGAVAFAIGIGFNVSESKGFLGALSRQISNARTSSGSLYRRLVIYKDAIVAWTSFGLMGMGPAGFSNYFKENISSSGLVNPHALVFEILTQYGIIIFICFIWLLLWMFRSAKKFYLTTAGRESERAVMVIAFVIIYVIVSFAPSSFLGYSYQWLLIAIMCSQIGCLKKKGGIVYA